MHNAGATTLSMPATEKILTKTRHKESKSRLGRVGKKTHQTTAYLELKKTAKNNNNTSHINE